MSKAQGSDFASDGHTPPLKSGTQDPSGLVAAEDGENGKPQVDDGAEMSGHTLLCRPLAPQGRRSLFRN